MLKNNLLKNRISVLKKSRSIRNSGWIIIQQIFQMLLQLIVGAITARYLGPSNYGTLSYTASFVAFFTSITTLGMDGIVVKKIIDYPEKEGLYLGSCMGLRLVSSLLSIFSVITAVYILNPNDSLKLVIVFLQSFQLTFKAIEILDSWFQRYLKSKYVSIGKMVASIIISIYKIILLYYNKSIIWFALANSLSELVIALVEYVFFTLESGTRLKFSFKTGIEVLKESYHFIISGLMVAVYSQMDRIMIGSMMTDIDVGYYTTATAICGMWVFVPTAVITSFQPTIMEAKNKNNEAYLRKLKQLYSFVFWLCIIVSIVVFIFAKLIIMILYGKEYLGAVSALRIAIWYETFAMIGTARGIWILCENKNKYVKYYLFIGTISNIFLNSLLIPKFGIEGAAIATLITQIITSIIAPMLFKETRFHSKIVLEAILLKWD